MKTYHFETYDVFTKDRFSGNPLAVVFDADGLTTTQMQTITREFNLSETTFILPPEEAHHTAKVRIFTIGYEMPFAGHPTVGTSIAIARSRNISDQMTLELNAGIFPIDLKFENDNAFAEFSNPNLPQEVRAAPSPAAIEQALSLPEGSINGGGHMPRIISAGAEFLYANTTKENVERAVVDMAVFKKLEIDHAVGVLLYADEDGMETTFHTRMFAPNAGIIEDPATGSAAAGLPGQIALGQSLGTSDHHWTVAQGVEMGRPSLINLRLLTKGDLVTSVKVGGYAVPVQSGTLVV